MNFNKNPQPPASKKAKTSATINSKKISLTCAHCNFSTKTQTRKSASTNLIKHMQNNPECTPFLKHCPNIKCNFVCLEENAITRHLAQKTACGTVYHAEAATQREIMAISNSAVFDSNDICNRNPNLVKRHFSSIIVQNQGRIVDQPLMQSSLLPPQSNHESISTLAAHRMMATTNRADNLNHRTFSINPNKTPVGSDTTHAASLCDRQSLNLQSLLANEMITEDIREVNDTSPCDLNETLNDSSVINEPDTEMIEWAKHLLYLRSNSNSADFTNEETAFIELWEILEDNDIPFSIFNRISQWTKRNHSNISKTTTVTREAIKKAIERKVHGKELAERMNPISTTVHLPSGSTIQVPVMDIRYHIVQKLIDPELMRQQNLLLDLKDPLKKRTFTDEDPIGDVDTGTWQELTEKKLCTIPRVLLCALILFIDATTIDTLGKQSVEPVTSTLAIYNRAARNLANAWFHLGAIENSSNIGTPPVPLPNDQNNNANKSKTAEEKAKDYHCILSVILEPLKKLQKKGGFKWFLPTKDLDQITSLPGGNKDDWTEVIMQVPVQFVIGDTEGHDKLCCKQAGHGTEHLMRDCDVKMANGANWKHNCRFHTNQKVKSLYAERSLAKINFYNIRNPWWDIEMGGDDGGIYMATPHEILHQFHSGIVQNIFDEIKNLLNEKALNCMDKIVSRISIQLHRQSSSSSYPAMRAFKKGLHPGNSMTASEKMGRLSVIYLAMLTNELSTFIINSGHKKSFPKIPKEYYIRIILLLERTLGVHSFLKSDTIPRHLVRESRFGSVSDIEIKQEEGVPNQDEAPASCYFRTYMKHLHEVFPMLHGSAFKLLQVKKNDKVYFDGSNKALRFKWLQDNGLLISKKNSTANESNALTFLNVDKVVELMGYEVSVEGNGWKIPKYHAFLHLTRPIAYLGVPENYNGARSESNLIVNIKKPARRTNKNNATLTFQTMLRYSEQRTRSVAYSLLKSFSTERIEDCIKTSISILQNSTANQFDSINGSTLTLSFVRINEQNDGYVVSSWEGRHKYREVEYPPSTLEYIGERMFTNLFKGGGRLLPDEKIVCRTELSLRGTLIRCHPNYQSDGEWFDWITVKWDGYDDPIPAKVLMIMDLRHSKFYDEAKLKEMFPLNFMDGHDQEGLTNSIYLLVHSAKTDYSLKHPSLSKTGDDFYSRISTLHEMEDDGLFHIININMIVKPSIFVMESQKVDEDDKNTIVILSQQTGWCTKSFQQSNNTFEDGYMNCENSNGIPEPYFTLGIPDSRVRYICDAKGKLTSKPRKRLVLYKNEPLLLE